MKQVDRTARFDELGVLVLDNDLTRDIGDTWVSATRSTTQVEGQNKALITSEHYRRNKEGSRSNKLYSSSRELRTLERERKKRRRENGRATNKRDNLHCHVRVVVRNGEEPASRLAGEA
jgi:hypothetical protein